MNTQTLTYSTQNCCLVVALQPADFSQFVPVKASSRDYGSDFDEEEIGRELLTPLPAGLLSQATLELEADEFEQVSQCFLS